MPETNNNWSCHYLIYLCNPLSASENLAKFEDVRAKDGAPVTLAPSQPGNITPPGTPSTSAEVL